MYLCVTQGKGNGANNTTTTHARTRRHTQIPSLKCKPCVLCFCDSMIRPFCLRVSPSNTVIQQHNKQIENGDLPVAPLVREKDQTWKENNKLKLGYKLTSWHRLCGTRSKHTHTHRTMFCAQANAHKITAWLQRSTNICFFTRSLIKVHGCWVSVAFMIIQTSNN